MTTPDVPTSFGDTSFELSPVVSVHSQLVVDLKRLHNTKRFICLPQKQPVHHVNLWTDGWGRWRWESVGHCSSGARVMGNTVQVINFTYHTDKCPFLWDGWVSHVRQKKFGPLMTTSESGGWREKEPVTREKQRERVGGCVSKRFSCW